MNPSLWVVRGLVGDLLISQLLGQAPFGGDARQISAMRSRCAGSG